MKADEGVRIPVRLLNAQTPYQLTLKGPRLRWKAHVALAVRERASIAPARWAAGTCAGLCPTPIPTLASDPMQHQVRSDSEAGMNGVVAKPVDPTMRLQAMEACLSEPAARGMGKVQGLLNEGGSLRTHAGC